MPLGYYENKKSEKPHTREEEIRLLAKIDKRSALKTALFGVKSKLYALSDVLWELWIVLWS